MRKTETPDISVVLIAPDSYDSIRVIMAHLRAQTIARRLEVVLVSPDPERLLPTDEDYHAFHGVHVVPYHGEKRMGKARALGVRQAQAPYVALTENHAFPNRRWAEVLLGRHLQGYAGVGPQMSNHNPSSRTSWVSFLLAYGWWAEPDLPREPDMLPGHNSSYRRDLLLEFGDDLDGLLDAETLLHWQLAAQGHKLYLDPAANVSHVNGSLLFPFLAEFYHYGRGFAAVRSESWSKVRRWTAALATPLMGLHRLRMLRQAVHTRRCPYGFWSMMPAALLAVAGISLGHAIGFLCGPAKDASFSWRYELYRDQLLCDADRQVLALPSDFPKPKERAA